MALFFCVVMVQVEAADGQAQRARFLEQSFPGGVPRAQTLWLRGEVKSTIKEILGHSYPALRIRHWVEGERSAWILEEVGKEQPITVGLLVNGNKLERLKVLVYRESRGGEVRHDFFTRQFSGIGLNGAGKLDRRIDSITGATLSVQALKKLARIALYLDTKVQR